MLSVAPGLLSTFVIAGDAFLAAEVSCMLARRGAYLPVIEAPRMQRPDAAAEVVRCNNAAARMQPKTILFAGVAPKTVAAFGDHFPRKRTYAVATREEVPPVEHRRRVKGTLRWGRKNIGLGLMRALRERLQIVFDDDAESPSTAIPPEKGCDHVVVYEDDTDLSAVIAANYAYALGGGLARVPGVPKQERERILEMFYGVYDDREQAPPHTLRSLAKELKERSQGLALDGCRMATFVTQGLPWGFAFPECPTTHVFSYPDLGRSLLAGVLAEQPRAPGIRVALLIDPDEEQADDTTFAIEALRHRGVFVRSIGSNGATVYRVSRALELFPYDFLMISTHCGDAPGWRWTYEFTDRDGLDRTLVIDVAIHVAHVPGEEKLEVMEFNRFVSLDGVDWNDPNRASKVTVGNAIQDYLDRTQAPERLIPVKKETINRVVGSAALQLFNGNYLPVEVSYADECTPIVLNNACSSWHRLARTFTFGNARAYIGTLFPVIEFEAQEIAERLLNRHFGKPLALALWHAQNEVFGEGKIRRPYALVGAHFQTLRTTHVDAPSYIVARLEASLRAKLRMMREGADLSDGQRRSLKDHQRWLADEIRQVRKRWLA